MKIKHIYTKLVLNIQKEPGNRVKVVYFSNVKVSKGFQTDSLNSVEKYKSLNIYFNSPSVLMIKINGIYKDL